MGLFLFFVWTIQAPLLGLSSQAVIKYLKLVSQTWTLAYFKPVQTLEYFSFSSFSENYWLACLPLIWTEQKEQLWFWFGYVLSWASTWSLAAAQQCSVSTASGQNTYFETLLLTESPNSTGDLIGWTNWLLLFLKRDFFQTHLERLSTDQIAINIQPQTHQYKLLSKAMKRHLSLISLQAWRTGFLCPKIAANFWRELFLF